MRGWMFVFMLFICVAGCTPRHGGATDLLPSVPNTNVVEGQTITQFIGKLADGATLIAGHPELVLVVDRVENTLVCYQNLGAAAVRAYSDQSSPLSAGMIAILDRSTVTNPANVFACLTSSGGAQMQQVQIQPCTKSYTLQKDNNEFYIAYVASTQEMCNAFCSKLEGCTK